MLNDNTQDALHHKMYAEYSISIPIMPYDTSYA